MFSISAGRYWFNPALYLNISTFLQLSSMRSMASSPFARASLMVLMASATFSGNKSRSLPAFNAMSSIFPEGCTEVTPFISSPSVTISPLKPSSFLRIPVVIFSDRLEGKFLAGSSAGTLRWAVMMPSKPFSMRWRKGLSSMESKCVRL